MCLKQNTYYEIDIYRFTNIYIYPFVFVLEVDQTQLISDKPFLSIELIDHNLPKSDLMSLQCNYAFKVS